MTLDGLSIALQRAVNEDLITMAQVERALNMERKAQRNDERRDGTGDGADQTDEDYNDQNSDESGSSEDGDSDTGDGDSESESDGDSESDGSDDADGDSESDSDDGDSESESGDDGSDNDNEQEQGDDPFADARQRGFEDAVEGKPRDDEYMQREVTDPFRQAYEEGYNYGEEKNEDDKQNDGESEQEQEQEDNRPTCDCCGKQCDENELTVGEEGTDYEGAALCEKCDAENNARRDHIHDSFDRICKYVDAGLNVALVGPAGTGKSYLARKVAEHLGRDFYVNGAMMSKYDLIGYNDAHGTYHSTPAHDAFVHGGVHCFDELDASAPDAVVAFNGMTDDQPFYTFPCGQVNQHDDYVAIACMNTFGTGASADYVGRYKQDAAAMDRFVKVYVGYDAIVERKIAGKNVDILHRVWATRAACEELGIRHIVSMRMIKKACVARAYKATKAEIDQDIIFAGLDDAAIAQLKPRVTAKVKELREKELKS
jgi:hypothetical protein